MVDGRILVERKTMDDFLRSVVDGRLFRQANALARSPQPGVIILEGTTHARRRGLGRRQVQGALLVLALVFQVPLVRSQGPKETAWLLQAISRQVRRKFARGLAARHWNPRDGDAQRIRVLASCPGMGPTRAEQLLMRFGTLEAVFAAEESELRQVPLVGAKTARALHEFLRRRDP